MNAAFQSADSGTVRHAQGIHNVASQEDHDALFSDEFLDAPLSPLGFEQAANLRERILAFGLLGKIELVITSPLLRAIQTAVGVFGCDQSNLKGPPIVAIEFCRERLGLHPCDKRRNINEHKPRFPSVDFSLIESDEDILWKPDVRETDEEIRARGLKFLNWLWTRQEKKIAIVAHNRFLEHTLSALEYGNHQLLKSEMIKEFHNCELRSLAIAENMAVASVVDENLPTGAEENISRKDAQGTSP